MEAVSCLVAEVFAGRFVGRLKAGRQNEAIFI